MDAENARLSDVELAELTAFADGSLPREECELVAARLERSPLHRNLVAEQRAALSAVASIGVRAPGRLQAAVAASAQAAVMPAAPRRPRFTLPRLALGGALAAALATGALGVAIVTSAGTPTIGDTAELAEHGPAAGAPAIDSSDARHLAVSVAGVPFPNYPEWQRSGARVDELDGRVARTVFYTRGGQRVAYSIVAGEPLEWPEDVRLADRDGLELRTLEYDDSHVVTWLRNGHTCVISSADVGTGRLLDLAAWKGEREAA